MITFSKALQTNDLLHIHNNNVIEFTTDVASPKVRCIVSIGLQSLLIYPSSNGVFQFNFKDISKVLLSNFNDNLFVNYSFTNQYIQTPNLKLAYSLSVQHLNGVTNLFNQILTFTDSKQNKKENRLVVNPFFQSNKNVKIYKKYPFDISFYNTQIISNSLATQLNLGANINGRLFLSDGFNFDLNNFFVNSKLLKTDNQDLVNFEILNPNCLDGHYIKWFNRYGGWSYWLFDRGSINRSAKEIGQVNNDFDNFNTSISRSKSLGRTSRDTLTVISDVISQEYLDLLVDLIDTPKIYLFTGTPNTIANVNDWLEIELKNTTMPVQNNKRDLYDITFTFDLPENYTQTL